MRWMQIAALRLRSLFHRNQVECELDDELQFHLEQQTEDNIRRGMDPVEARAAARRTIGGIAVLEEECRDERRVNWIENLVRDIGYALRGFRKNPGFAATAVLSLALGIGANTTIFSMINAVLLKLLPVRDPQQLVVLSRTNNQRTGMRSWPYPFYREVREQKNLFAGVLARSGSQPTMAVGGSAERVTAELVTGNYYDVLGVTPYLGRLFGDNDDHHPGGDQIAVLSHTFWTKRFGADPAIVGTTIRLNTVPFTIVGVTPPGFEGLNVGSGSDLQVPISMQPIMFGGGSMLNERGDWWISVVGRLQPGVNGAQAASALRPLLLNYLRQTEKSPMTEYRKQQLDSTRIDLLAGHQGMGVLQNELSKPLIVLMGMVGIVLLIACVNLANLLLARASARQREISIRLAIGASRARLIRQLLTESLLLSGAGGVLGLSFAIWSERLLLRFAPENNTMSIAPDLTVFAFTAALSIVTGIVFGLMPALQATRSAITSTLKLDTPQAGAGRMYGRKLLVSAQVGLSLLLLIGAGLFVRSLRKLETMDLGFDTQNLVMLTADPRQAGYITQPKIREFHRRVLERIRNTPGVRAASAASSSLISNSEWGSGIWVEGYTVREGDNGPLRTTVGPKFFSTVAMPIVRGRDFDEHDNETAPKVAVINESFANYYFAGRDPMGKRIGPGSREAEYTIVGVTKDAHYSKVRQEKAPKFWFIPYSQHKSVDSLAYHVRTVGDANRMIKALRAAIADVDKNVAVSEVRTLEVQIAKQLLVERLVAVLAAFFGFLAALLACVGLYGVMTYATNRRTREIGIRIALGAEQGAVLWMVLRETLVLVAAGIAIGLPAAFVLTRFVESLLYGVKGTDFVAAAGATALISLVSIGCGLLPAWRASRVDAMVALRWE